jgi:glycosyltransferase involved in cell wall biosynthesis
MITAGHRPLRPHAAGDGIAVVVSTRGRPHIVADLVRHLDHQVRRPDHIFIVATRAEDIARIEPGRPDVTTQVGRPGSSSQRNDGLTLAGSGFRYIVFMDDDFVPSRFWLERMERVFETRPDIHGLTGVIMADGTRNEGIDPGEAEAMVAARDREAASGGALHERFAYGNNVGCNMAYRYAAIRDLRFDENLPAYAWHEDSDFRGQVETRGLFAKSEDLWGVHLGHKLGRSSGLAFGYSQIANPVYLARKGTVPAGFLMLTACRNLLANGLRSVRPEPFCDRRGRLRGNVTALIDGLRGRLAPQRILEL